MGKGKIVGNCKICSKELHQMNLSKSIISEILFVHSKCFYKSLRKKGLVNAEKKFKIELDLYCLNHTLENDDYLDTERRFVEKTYRRIKYSKQILRL